MEKDKKMTKKDLIILIEKYWAEIPMEMAIEFEELENKEG
jgi:hypothetical protein